MNVLITGGSGTFGQAFARWALDNGAQRVCIFSRDEWKQAQMRHGFGDDDRLRWFIGDVRDYDRLRRAFKTVEVVIHAAALKRVEVGEYNPEELVKTNVNGTVNVVQAATDAGVGKVVLLSTDKACAPVNAYGTSKLMAEKIVLAAQNAGGTSGPLFAVTRYGNVAGSRGSVIHRWRESKRDAFMSHPDCTRFWMSLRDAVRIVWWTIRNMRGGELVVPDLPAYRLGDLAEAMDVNATVSGMGPGEKFHEAMVNEEEFSSFSYVGPYWVKGGTGQAMRAPLTSDKAPRFTVAELRQKVALCEYTR